MSHDSHVTHCHLIHCRYKNKKKSIVAAWKCKVKAQIWHWIKYSDWCKTYIYSNLALLWNMMQVAIFTKVKRSRLCWALNTDVILGSFHLHHPLIWMHFCPSCPLVLWKASSLGNQVYKLELNQSIRSGSPLLLQACSSSPTRPYMAVIQPVPSV